MAAQLSRVICPVAHVDASQLVVLLILNKWLVIFGIKKWNYGNC